MPILHFLGGTAEKKGTLILTSLLEDLGVLSGFRIPGQECAIIEESLYLLRRRGAGPANFVRSEDVQLRARS